MVVTHENFRSNSVYKLSVTTAISYTTSDAFCLQKLDMYNKHSFIYLRKVFNCVWYLLVLLDKCLFPKHNDYKCSTGTT